VTEPDWQEGTAVPLRLQRPTAPRVYLNHADGSKIRAGQGSETPAVQPDGWRSLWVYVDRHRGQHLVLATPRNSFKEVGRET